MKKLIAAVSAVFSLSAAHAYPLIDFEGLSDGAAVGDFYNGGAGPNYGIHFSGGVVRHGSNGNYISGPFEITFAPHSDLSSIAYQATRTDDWGGTVNAYSAAGIITSNWIQGTANPFCRTLTPSECLSRGYSYIPPDKLFPYQIGDSSAPWLKDVSRVVFQSDLADNIAFLSATWTDPAGGGAASIPLPGTLWLIAIASVSLLLRKRPASV